MTRAICAILFTALLSSCVPLMTTSAGLAEGVSQNKQTLTIFAAASLTEAFSEAGEVFESYHPGVRVLTNFAGSQQLAYQLAQDAPADIFASADQRQMQAAIQAGRVAPHSVSMFSQNHLVVIYPVNNPASLSKLNDLSAPGLKLILADQAVPVGHYSLDFLQKASQDPSFGPDYESRVLGNVVSYETNVRAVLSKVVLGEADAGIVYASDITPSKTDQIGQLGIPEALNATANYYIAPLADSSQGLLIDTFISFILAKEGQEILLKHGFSAVRKHDSP